MYFEDYNDRQRTFEQVYRCYPTTFIDKPQLENGDKIIMPPSALDRLASLNIDYPMLFELENSSTQRVSHCGVLEFIAEEGMVYLPYWMMQNLLLEEGDVVRIKSATLPKGTYVKLQPHTTDFLDISNPKAILETSLRSFSCLTTGDTIMVAYNNKKYYIDIVETKPSAAVSIIETDCEVDFAPPLDYKEPEKPGKPAPLAAPPQAEEPVEEESKFSPFTGTARRLNGRPAEASPSPAPAPLSTAPKARAARAANGAGSSPPPLLLFLLLLLLLQHLLQLRRLSSHQGGSSCSDRPTGSRRAWRRGEGAAPIRAVAKDPPPQPPKEEEPEFKPFTGRRYSLRD
ncbi:unnamed protein product [Spirodela intermedia]|uniref:Uncharacterized protein n=1 Tax=Spirodela intermedia TaxID=51605 RepID=A0A7I8IDT2_SPIIN|nr:unnamed protein product [Spirodela intermedia]CAA6655001.1 unnamed protein product [Spirodela intermedia]